MCGKMDRVVELAVAAAGESMTNYITAGRRDWSGARVACEVVAAREAADVSDV